MQAAVIAWADSQTHPALRWLFHVPNGEYRTKATAGRLVGMGVKGWLSRSLAALVERAELRGHHRNETGDPTSPRRSNWSGSNTCGKTGGASRCAIAWRQLSRFYGSTLIFPPKCDMLSASSRQDANQAFVLPVKPGAYPASKMLGLSLVRSGSASGFVVQGDRHTTQKLALEECETSISMMGDNR